MAGLCRWDFVGISGKIKTSFCNKNTHKSQIFERRTRRELKKKLSLLFLICV